MSSNGKEILSSRQKETRASHETLFAAEFPPTVIEFSERHTGYDAHVLSWELRRSERAWVPTWDVCIAAVQRSLYESKCLLNVDEDPSAS